MKNSAIQNQESYQILTILRKIIRRRKFLVTICLIGALAPIIAYNRMATPTYEASTVLVFEEFQGPLETYSYDSSREIYLFNRMEEIKSYAFAEDIASALSPDLYQRLAQKKAETNDQDDFGFVAAKIQKGMKAYPVRNSNIIRINVQLNDPLMCQSIANIAAQVFKDRNFKIRKEGASGVRVHIEDQLATFDAQLTESEEALKDYKLEHRITSVDKESKEFLTRITEAEVMLNKVIASRGSLEERLDVINKKLSEHKRDLVPSITNISTPWAQKLKDRLVTLQEQYTDLRIKSYSSDHPKMLQLNNEIEQIKKQLKGEALKLAQQDNLIDPLAQIEKYVDEAFKLQVELETLKAQESALRGIISKYNDELASLPDKEFQLARLMRDRDVNQKIYMMLLEKREEARIAEAEKIANIRIIDQAQLPRVPISPRKSLNLAIGFMLGLVIGFGTAFILEAKQMSVESSEELEQLTDWPVLATVPKINGKTNGKSKSSKDSGNGPILTPVMKRAQVFSTDPYCNAAEAYRMLRTNLQFNELGNNYKTLLITSIGPGDGKSTTVANLAAALANLGQDVLVLDADLRKPSQHSLFGLDPQPGLGDLLVELDGRDFDVSISEEEKKILDNVIRQGNRADLLEHIVNFGLEENFDEFISNLKFITRTSNEFIRDTEIKNLKVLATGSKLQNPSEAITSKTMRLLLFDLKEHFNFILIDSAPLLLVPDTMILSAIADGVVLVVDSKKHNDKMVLRAKNVLENADAKVLGTVLNNEEFDEVYSRYGYYYSS